MQLKGVAWHVISSTSCLKEGGRIQPSIIARTCLRDRPSLYKAVLKKDPKRESLNIELCSVSLGYIQIRNSFSKG